MKWLVWLLAVHWQHRYYLSILQLGHNYVSIRTHYYTCFKNQLGIRLSEEPNDYKNYSLNGAIQSVLEIVTYSKSLTMLTFIQSYIQSYLTTFKFTKSQSNPWKVLKYWVTICFVNPKDDISGSMTCRHVLYRNSTCVSADSFIYTTCPSTCYRLWE